MRICIAAAAALAALWAGGAAAQIGQGDGPTYINADSVDFQNDAGRIIYEGGVEAAQGDARLRADRLEVEFEQSGEAAQSEDGSMSGIGSTGDIQRIIAIGDVYYVTPQETATGNRAVYELATDTIIFTGNVVVTQGCDVSTGEKLVVNLETGNSQMLGGQTESGGRVQMVLYPEEEAEQRDNCE